MVLFLSTQQNTRGRPIDPTEWMKTISTKTDRSALPPKFGVDTDYWSEYNSLADDHDREWTETLNSHLDYLLIFAGLFASINTAFIVLSLDLLKATASDETNNLLRLFLRSQMVEETSIDAASQPWELEVVAIQTSYFFSASLSCTLLAALGALVGKQWVVFYQKPEKTKTPNERAITRQKKYDGVKTYYFRSLLDALSFLIQLAVLLFLVGFMVYLWDLHEGVATMVFVITTLGFLGYVVTLWAACYDEYCPFQTPLSVALRRYSTPTPFSNNRTLLFVSKTWSRMVARFHGTGRTPQSDVEKGAPGAAATGTQEFHPNNWMIDLHTEDSQVAQKTVDDGSRASELEFHIEHDTTLFNSYVMSLRWVLKTASREFTLLEAAWNLPALRQANSTRFIFQRQPPILSRFFGSIRSIIRSTSSDPLMPIYHTSTYERLVSLLQSSMVRLLLTGDGDSSTAAEDTLVYGRAVLHCLIQSNKAAEGFALLSTDLKKYIPYAWRSTRGELRVLLACILNDSGYWEHVEDVDDLQVNLSVLPIYAASLSIICPPRYYGRWIHFVLDQWCKVIPRVTGSITKTPSPAGSASLVLSQSTVTPRVLGLAAVSLVRGRILVDESLTEPPSGQSTEWLGEALRPMIWKQYEGDGLVYWRTLKALEAYPGLDFEMQLRGAGSGNDENNLRSLKRTPYWGENEAYCAFIKAVGLSLDMLFDPTESNQLPFQSRQREEHKLDLRGLLGQNIVATMKGILASVLSQDSTSDRQNLLEETISFIGKAVIQEDWNLSSEGLDPLLIWQSASHIREGSIAVYQVLTLMRDASPEGDNFYEKLFQRHPSAASMLMMALYDERAEVRRLSGEIFTNQGDTWLVKDGVKDLFSDNQFSKALSKHIQMRKPGDDPDVISDIAKLIRDRNNLNESLLNSLYDALVDPQAESKMHWKEVLETSMDIWSECFEQLSADTQKNWQSASMMMAVTEYVKEEYKKANQDQRQFLIIPSWLDKYHQHVVKNRDSSATATLYWFSDIYRQYRGLGDRSHSR